MNGLNMLGMWSAVAEAPQTDRLNAAIGLGQIGLTP